MKKTLDDVLKVVAKLDRNAMNATTEDGGTCVYTDYNGNHCIAGQVCVELGIEVPEADSDVVTLNEKFKKNFDESALTFLGSLQSYADSYTFQDKTLGAAIDQTLSQYDLSLPAENDQ